MRAALGPNVRWVRAMPSPACRNGHGLTALAFDHNFPAAAKREVKSLFAKVGPVLEIPERKFDAFTVTYSCSHGYHALATLAGEAEKLGLDRQTALTAAAHALADGIVGVAGRLYQPGNPAGRSRHTGRDRGSDGESNPPSWLPASSGRGAGRWNETGSKECYVALAAGPSCAVTSVIPSRTQSNWKKPHTP